MTRAIPASEPAPGRGRKRGPDLTALARAALDRAVALAGLPDLTLAPSELGLTGMETYVWLDEAPGPISATASAGGVTVVAEASPSRYTWDFGDGYDVVTTHAGRPWSEAHPGSIDHIYERRGTYDLAVEVLWSARWRVGAGPWRALGFFATSDSDTLPVRQVQSRLVDEDYEG